MSDTTVDEVVLTPVSLTPPAIEKAKYFQKAEGRDDLVLRIAVQPGGCAGLMYELGFDDQVNSDDLVNEFDGVKLVVDSTSAPYLSGATIDFVDTLNESGFTVDNPNAQSGCSCGDSFC